MKRLLAALLLALTALAAGAAPIITPADHRRGEERTYLTFPEWYLVHSPAELATYLSAERAPSEFAWGGHGGQFWRGYLAAKPVTAVVLDRAPTPLPAKLAEMRRIEAGSDAVLMTLPRYRAFLAYAQALAAQEARFREIAGYRGVIERSDAVRPSPPLRPSSCSRSSRKRVGSGA